MPLVTSSGWLLLGAIPHPNSQQTRNRPHCASATPPGHLGLRRCQTCTRKNSDGGQARAAPASRGSSPISAKELCGHRIKKKINSKLKHIKCGIESKEAFLSLFLKQDKNICLERLPCSQELCLGHLYVSRALHRVGVQEMLAQ